MKTLTQEDRLHIWDQVFNILPICLMVLVVLSGFYTALWGRH